MASRATTQTRCSVPLSGKETRPRWPLIGDANLEWRLKVGILERGLKLAKRRDYLARRAMACPSCRSEQVQLTAYDQSPAIWRCRKCKYQKCSRCFYRWYSIFAVKSRKLLNVSVRPKNFQNFIERAPWLKRYGKFGKVSLSVYRLLRLII